MSEMNPDLPETAPAPADIDALRERQSAVRKSIARLFRKRGDSAAMRALEQAVLEYRLAQLQ